MTAKTLSAREALALGYLLDLNRRWAHPLGLEVQMDKKTGALTLVDYRHLPGGPIFADRMPADAARKAERVEEERAQRRGWRREIVGGEIEQVEGYADPPRRIAGLSDPSGWQHLTGLAAQLGADVATEAAEAMAPGEETATFLMWLSERVADLVLARGFVHLLGQGAVDAAGRFVPCAFTEGPAEDTSATSRLARLHSLLREIGRLQEDYGQLYPEEVAAVAQTGSTSEGQGETWAGLSAALAELERLYGLAQPGMRYFRGDRDAREAFDKHRDALSAQVRRVMGARSEAERFIAGELPAEDVNSPADVAAELERQLVPLREHTDELRADLARTQREFTETNGRREVLERALQRLRDVGERVLQ